MDLSQEDSLRLNVLVKTSVAIRIDENQLVIFGLADSKERRIDLKPSGNAGQYLRLIREHLSNLVLGTPGGYPVFIQRWTRSGALGAERLSKLLCLGETEAVVAVAASPNITDTLAGRAWWCLPTAEVARLMLCRSQVIKGQTGPPLAQFLLEYLPFEIESTVIIQTVQILLVSELIDQSEKARLWARGQKNAAYLIGFLSAGPEYMIQTDHQKSVGIADLAKPSKTFAQHIERALSQTGKQYLEGCSRALRTATDMDSVVETLEALHRFLMPIADTPQLPRTPHLLRIAARERFNWAASKFDDEEFAFILSRYSESDIKAIILLSLVGEPLVAPIFAITDASGSLMRKKLAPALDPAFEAIKALGIAEND